MLVEILLYIIIFIYGIVIGSFVNVLIYRLPLHENITTEHSHCMSCGHRLRWYDLVPLFSWVFLKGKCRYCKTKISAQYPVIEAVNGFGYVLIFIMNGFNFTGILYALCFSMLTAITVIDWRTYEIPLGLNITILVLGAIHLALDIIIFCIISSEWYLSVDFFCFCSLSQAEEESAAETLSLCLRPDCCLDGNILSWHLSLAVL